MISASYRELQQLLHNGFSLMFFSSSHLVSFFFASFGNFLDKNYSYASLNDGSKYIQREIYVFLFYSCVRDHMHVCAFFMFLFVYLVAVAVCVCIVTVKCVQL